MIDLSVFNKALVSVQNPGLARARDIALRTALHVPVLGGWVCRAGMKPKPRFRRGEYLGLDRARIRGIEGALPPQPVVRRSDGRRVRLDDALGIGWAVIGFEIDPREALGADTVVWEGIGASFSTVYRAGGRPQGRIGDGGRTADLLGLEDTAGVLTAWLRRAGHRPGTVLVLRPDKYVFGASHDATELTRELERRVAPSGTDRRTAGRTTVTAPTETGRPS